MDNPKPAHIAALRAPGRKGATGIQGAAGRLYETFFVHLFWDHPGSIFCSPFLVGRPKRPMAPSKMRHSESAVRQKLVSLSRGPTGEAGRLRRLRGGDMSQCPPPLNTPLPENVFSRPERALHLSGRPQWLPYASPRGPSFGLRCPLSRALREGTPSVRDGPL